MKDIETHTAIYLIGATPDGPTKIGISDDPERRLRQLQSAHPLPLFIYGVYWLASRRLAEVGEAFILKDYCKERRLRGEWVSKPARELSPMLAGFLSIKLGHHNLLRYEEQFVIEATDEEVFGLVPPRHGARATDEQMERLGVFDDEPDNPDEPARPT